MNGKLSLMDEAYQTFQSKMLESEVEAWKAAAERRKFILYTAITGVVIGVTVSAITLILA